MASGPANGDRPADLSVVVPTYNERDRIAELVQALFQHCRTHGIELELIVVDDNSPDGTGQTADELAGSYRMQVVHRSGKLGLGTAVVAGVAVATAEIVGVMDADFSHPPAMVPRLFSVAQTIGADLVIASRYIPGGSTPEWPLWRRVLSRTACLAARPLSPVRDPASGFFLIRRDIANRVSIKAGGFKICLELLMRGWPRRLVEVPYRFDDREQGESKMSFREAAGYLVQLRDLYLLRWSSGRRPRREYRRLEPAQVEAMLASRREASGARSAAAVPRPQT